MNGGKGSHIYSSLSKPPSDKDADYYARQLRRMLDYGVLDIGLVASVIDYLEGKSPAHSPSCDWHQDQYTHECTCGALQERKSGTDK